MTYFFFCSVKENKERKMLSYLLAWWNPVETTSEGGGSGENSAGRNIPPDLADRLRKAKIGLKSPEAISTLRSFTTVTEASLARARLRPTKIPRRKKVWKCQNPLFHELRQVRSVVN